MATNHTTNYQLNQWEATDQVLRTEFNADNAKIDAALKANADAIAAETAAREAGDDALNTRLDLHTLLTYTVTAGNQSGTLSIPLSINWGQWKCVYLRFAPILSENVTYDAMFNFNSVNSLGKSLPGELFVQFYPWRDNGAVISGIRWGRNVGFVSCPDLTFSGITEATFQTRDWTQHPFLTGTQMVLQGEA